MGGHKTVRVDRQELDDAFDTVSWGAPMDGSVRVEALAEHPPSGLPGAQHHAFQRAAVERGVLRLAGQLAGFDLPDPLRMEQAEIGRRALGQAAGLDAEQAGRAARSAARSPAARPDRAVVDLRQCHAQQRGQPGAAGAAWANGRRLSSASRGWWSEAMASIVPSASAAATARRSASLRSGGDSLA